LAVAVESDLIRHILSFDLPRVAVVEPEVGNLNLVTIFNGLFKDTIIVANTITPSRNVEGSKRIDETSGKTSKTTISESGISLLLVKFLKIVAHVHECVLELVFEV